MKKIFKSFLLVLMFIPFAFMAVACGKNDDTPPPYDKEQNVKAYNKATASYAELGDNYTMSIKLTMSDALKQMAGMSDMQDSVTVAVDGDAFKIINSMGDAYIIDGVAYSRGQSSSSQGAPYTVTTSPYGEMATSADIANKLTSIDLAGLQDLAFALNSEAIHTQETENGTVVTITLDVDALIKNVISTLKANKDSSYETLINSLLVNFGVEDTTVEDIVAFVKASVDEETTVGEMIARVENYTGLDLETVLNTFSFASKEIQCVHSGSDLPEEVSLGSYIVNEQSAMISSIDLEEMKDIPVLSLMGEEGVGLTKQEFDDVVDSYYEMFADATQSSLSIAINNYIETSEDQLAFTTVDGFFDMLEANTLDTLHVGISLELDNEDNCVGLGVNAEMSVVEEGSKITLSAGIDVDYSKVGTTVVELPSNLTVGEVMTAVNATLPEDGQNLVINNLDLPFGCDFSVHAPESSVNAITYDESTKTLTISAALLDVLAAKNENLEEGYSEYNVFIIRATASNDVVYSIEVYLN